jgi:drug/metabolite transporter (DMT)-like permease
MPPTSNRPLLGSFYMMLAMALYVCNDSIVKLASADLPLSTIIFVRGLFAVVMVLVVVMITGHIGSWRTMFSKQVLLRASLDTVSTFTFLTALFHLSIAVATSILQIIPLVVVVFGVVFLKEHIGWRRIAAIATGFVGVLMIIQPGSADFSVYSLLALATVFLVAFRDTVTRSIPVETPSLIVTLSNVTAVTIFGAFYTAFEGLAALTVLHITMLGVAAAFLVAATLVAILTMRVADISTTAPFRYSAILWSLLAAFFVFGDLPDEIAIIGIALIAISGVYTLQRLRH